MPYKSAAMRRIEELQEELLARDRQIAELMNADATKTIEASNNKLEAERIAAIQAQKEAARVAAWKLHNFDVAVKERPDQSLDWTAIDRVGEGWPSPEAEAEWSESNSAAAEAVAAVLQAAVGETKLGKMLKEVQDHHARLANT